MGDGAMSRYGEGSSLLPSGHLPLLKSLVIGRALVQDATVSIFKILRFFFFYVLVKSQNISSLWSFQYSLYISP